jgi:hypothetical protein
VQFDIDRTDSLAIDDRGTFLLNIDVGTAQGESRDAINGTVHDTSTFPVWKIENVQLEVAGVAE